MKKESATESEIESGVMKHLRNCMNHSPLRVDEFSYKAIRHKLQEAYFVDEEKLQNVLKKLLKDNEILKKERRFGVYIIPGHEKKFDEYVDRMDVGTLVGLTLAFTFVIYIEFFPIMNRYIATL